MKCQGDKRLWEAARRVAGGCWRALVPLLLVCWLSGGTDVYSDENRAIPSLDEISAAMARQQAEIKSLKVEYTVTASALGPPESLKKYLRVLYLVNERKTFAFKRQKRYFRVQGPPTFEELAPGVETDWNAVAGAGTAQGEATRAALERQAAEGKPKPIPGKKKITYDADPDFEFGFDGEKLRRKSAASHVAIVMPPDQVKLDSQYFTQDYFRCVGMTLPNVFDSADDRKNERFPDALARPGYRVHPSLEEVDGHECVVVSFPDRETLWLDPELNFAIRKHIGNYFQTKILGVIYRNNDFREVEPGVWLPWHSEFELCGPPRSPVATRGRPLIRYSYRVQKLTINNVPDSLFALTIGPGTAVVDSTVSSGGKSAYYVMPADSSRIDQAIAESLATQDRATMKAWWSQIILWGNLSIITLVVSYLGVRAIRRAKPRRRAT